MVEKEVAGFLGLGHRTAAAIVRTSINAGIARSLSTTGGRNIASVVLTGILPLR
jgi:hypothetical protein